ncbi:MAG: glycosyltransferase family 4 protein [Candidatus Omnitrophica bacterium]|nr:glycosyltransferase family 4 protein [Candidatus Omnitrophota bacterium]
MRFNKLLQVNPRDHFYRDGADNGKKIRVCLIMSTYLPVWGGVQRQLARLAGYFPRDRFELVLLTRSVPGAASCEFSDNMKIIRLFVTNRIKALDPLLFTAFSLWWLICNRSKFDVLHCFQIYSPAMIGVIARKILRDKKVLVKVTASCEFGEAREIKRLPLSGLRIRLLKEVDLFAVMSGKMADEIAELGIDRSKIKYIPNGVICPGESAFDAVVKEKRRAILGIKGDVVGIFTGRLSAEKNIDKLLFAWDKVREEREGAVLLILGEGGNYRNVEKELLKISGDLGLGDSVLFLGRVDNVYDHLLASDIFFLPSVSEGMSNSLLEAMACGLGVIAGDNDGNRTLIRDGVNGLIVNGNDACEIAGAAKRLIGDASLRISLGKAAKQTVIEAFSMQKVAESYENIYRGMTARAVR